MANVIIASNFELASCQAVLFTPEGDLSVSKTMKEFYPEFVDIFDGEPTVLPPVMEGAPLEIPRIILESSSKEWRFEFAPARASLHWRRLKSTQAVLNLENFFTKAIELLGHYAGHSNVRVGRLAALANRYAVHDTPAMYLARHFCKEQWDKAPLNRPENIELHAHKRFALIDGIQVNSWARNKSGRLSGDDNTQPIILFEQDLNTLAEEASDRQFERDDIHRFFRAALNELDIILKLYYPEC